MNFCDLIYKSQPVRFACPQVRQENIAGFAGNVIINKQKVYYVNDKRGRLSHFWILSFYRYVYKS